MLRSVIEKAGPSSTRFAVNTGTYQLSESANDGGDRTTGYLLESVTCAPKGAETTNDGEAVSSASVSIEKLDDVVCTFTNAAKPAKLTLIKKVIGGSAAPEDWTLTATGSKQTVSGPGPKVIEENVKAGKYALTESASAPSKIEGYDWTGLMCISAEDGSFNGTFSAASAEGVVSRGDLVLRPGDDVECTFTNTADTGSVTWEKVDAENSELFLAGSVWELTGPDTFKPVEIEDCISADKTCSEVPYTDQDPDAGKFRIEGLPWGVTR